MYLLTTHTHIHTQMKPFYIYCSALVLILAMLCILNFASQVSFHQQFRKMPISPHDVSTMYL